MRRALVFFMICGAVTALADSAAPPIPTPPPSVWDCFTPPQASATPYVALLNCVRQFEPNQSTPKQGQFAFDQAYATTLSQVGQEKRASQICDRAMGLARPPESVDFSTLKKQPAVDFITEAAKAHKVIMINEAHHVPQTRGLTIQLLKPLFEQGFRYLAAETFYLAGMEQANTLGFPTRQTGFYVHEPMAGALVREAKRIGFKLVAYEYDETCDYTSDPTGCQDKREQGQARNLIERIFKNDPNAKVVVHAGYGHIDKIGGDTAFPWKPMARYFKEFTGIDPLSVDQVEFREHGRIEAENSTYRDIVKTFAINTPSVLTTASGSAWVWPSLVGHYDIQVILPLLEEAKGRPFWRISELKQQTVSLALPPACRKGECLVQAVRKEEAQQEFVPSDQILVDSQNHAILLLGPGVYLVSVVDLSGQVLKHLNMMVQ